MSPRTTLTIDLGAIEQNVRTIKAHAHHAAVMAVLKANAYGIGIEPLIKAVLDGGAHAIGVATPNEAIQVRSFFQGPLHLLGACFEDELQTLIDLDIIFPISSATTLHTLHTYATQARKKAKVHILIDTGMGRLGVLFDDALTLVHQARMLPQISLLGCYSHLSNAFKPNDPHTTQQLATFIAFKNRVQNHVIESVALPTPPVASASASKSLPASSTSSQPPLCFHLANSDGVHNYPETCFDMIRTGINLYGLYDLEGRRRYPLKPALSFTSKIIAIRNLPAGSTIGYGVTHRLPKPTHIATIAAGYADGIPLALANQFHVIIAKATYPIVGRISMDYLTVSLGENPHNIKVGDPVILFGSHHNLNITVDQWARLKQTHTYDIITSISQRVTRVYHSSSTPHAEPPPSAKVSPQEITASSKY